MGLDEMKQQADKEARQEKEAELTGEERARQRADMPIMIHELNTREYVLQGATREDVENNPDLMRKFNRAMFRDRQFKGDNTMVGGGI